MKAYITSQGFKFEISGHALDRMSLRHIRISDIKYVLDNYYTTHDDCASNACFIGKLLDGRKLRVVLSKDNNPPRVITCIALG